MTREEFEAKYAQRHMGYDPRPIKDKIDSVERSRNWEGYFDSHMDRCWKDQQCIELLEKSKIAKSVLVQAKSLLRW